MSALQIDQRLYLEVIRDFQRLYPGDAALAMVLLDYYSFQTPSPAEPEFTTSPGIAKIA